VRKSDIIEKIAKCSAKYLTQTIYILDISSVYALSKTVDFVV